jgi:outer membrane receptor protein involved in Fe transport
VPARHGGRPAHGHRPLSPARRLLARPLGGALLTVLWAGRAFAGDDRPPEDKPSPRPPRLAEQVTVTATRSDARIGDTPASVAVVPKEALGVTASPALDDALRQVVGFGLFRRTGSRTANPTVQGVSLRGVGASGASRATVLVDGVPLNDPFGGWIYWGRVPRLAVDRLEVLRGGASDLYGGAGLGGAVQVLTLRPGTGAGLDLEASGGEAGLFDGGMSAHATRGAWAGRLSAEALHTDGYVPVDEGSRGPVDRPAGSRHVAADALLERSLGEDGRVFLRGSWYGEARGNGTVLQTNSTRIGLVAAGLERGGWSAHAWGTGQELRQSFTAVTANRAGETLTREQRVPADAFGLSGQWVGSLGPRHRLAVGLEARRVSGTTFETGYAGGDPASRLEAGGEERSAAIWAEDLVQVRPRLLLTASARLDEWQHRDGRSSLRSLVGSGPPSESSYADRVESALSPRIGLLFHASRSLSFAAAGYGSFRGPTLNELYRPFRVGSVVTLANPSLSAERLRGGEVGARWAAGSLALRITAFGAEVRDPVANVTLEETPELVTRQRQNLGRIRTRGLEAEGETRVGRRGVVAAGYAWTDARVASFPADPSLEDLRLPQVPRHQAVLQARYEGAWRLGLQARWTGAAFDDDRNEWVLDPAFVVDVFVGRVLGRGVELFATAENLLDARVIVGRTPIPTAGAPRQLRAGVRFRGFGHARASSRAEGDGLSGPAAARDRSRRDR